MTPGKISVALATYNGEQYIHQQLASILSQLDESAEVIISDNGSTDKTIEIIKSFNDKRIIIHHFDKKSVVLNFENALKYVTGDIIFLSDQDDVWLENKVETAKHYLQQHDLFVSDCKIVDGNLNVISHSFFRIKNAGPGLLKNLISNTYHGCNMAFKKKVLQIALPFPKNIPMHDIWIGFVSDMFFSTCFVSKPLVLHRRHDKNTSTATKESTNNLLQKINFRLQLLLNMPLLFKRIISSKIKRS